ncbi:MAG: 6-bladed beta-propeller [Paramuribaculum sp.]|nr:6-bladed beta-propeller [Paramuribaculum sp.]
MYKIFATLAILLLSVLIFGSCQSKSEELEKGRIIHVDIEPQEVAVEDLFDRIEVVPLETTDSALLVFIDRARVDKNEIFLNDRRTMKVYRFDDKGRFKNTIGRIGQGPGEYAQAYDFDVDPYSGNVFIITPYGDVNEYDRNGNYLQSFNPPSKRYSEINRVDDSHWLTWEGCYIGENAISVFNNDFTEEVFAPNIPRHMANTAYSSPNFFHNGGELYATFSYDRNVYKVTADSMMIAYTWDFGSENLDEKSLEKHDINPYEATEEVNMHRTWNFISDTSIKCSLERQSLNSRYNFVVYYYTVEMDPVTRRGVGPIVFYNVIHDRKTGKSYVFDKLTNGMSISEFLLMTDDYMLVMIRPNELPLYEEYLPEGMKLSDIDPDDDNPVLARFYFKK